MTKPGLEFSVGAFLVLGLLCLAYLAFNLGEVGAGSGRHYQLFARFTSASGLREGAFVEIAGVRVGTVHRIVLDRDTFESVVELRLDPGVKLQSDTIASIRTAGIIGDKFVKLAPGGADALLPDGGDIAETEASISLEELISKYIFESGK